VTTAVIAGIGRTKFTRGGAVTEAALASRAILAALDDAGLAIEDVDGLVRFDREALWEFDLPGVARLANLPYYGAVPFGSGSAPALVRLAAMAVSLGLARVVVGYHARHGVERSTLGDAAFVPFGLVSGVQAAAVVMRRRGVTPAMLTSLTCAMRTAAAKNPAALARTPLAAAAHRKSPFVAEPLRRADVALPAVGAGAFVVTAADRAARRTPVRVLASMQAALPSVARHLPEWYARKAEQTLARAARRMFRAARLRPSDVDAAYLHADPAGLVPIALEDYGFCKRGGAAAFLRGRGVRLNPHGGQLAEASLDGINDVLAAVRALRGDGVRGVRTALVAGSPLEPTSAVLLGV
jgi:acetyl-CoA acetyltransferase